MSASTSTAVRESAVIITKHACGDGVAVGTNRRQWEPAGLRLPLGDREGMRMLAHLHPSWTDFRRLCAAIQTPGQYND